MRLYHLIKLTLLNLAFAAVYYALARAGLSFATINHSASPIWPASGFAISTLILGGPSLLPGIFLAAFFANLPTGSGLSAALLIAFGNSAEALCARWMFYRVTRMRRLLQNYTGAAAFIVSSAFATMVSASVGALALWLFAGLAGQQADDVWLTWWAGDALGSLLIAPVILGLTARIRAHALTIRQLAGAAVAGLPALAVAGVVFSSDAGSPWLFAIFPFVLLAATLVREAELRMITLAVATCAIAFVINKQGPFNDGDVNLNLIHLQLFLASLALTSLVIEAFKKIGSLLPPALALCAGWILSGVLFFSLHRYEHADEGRRFVNTVELAEERIRAHLRAHEDILLSGVGLFAASRAVEGYEWDVFVRSQALDNRFPDLESLSALLADGTEMSIPIKNAQATPIFRDSLAESISKVNRRPALALRGTRASLYYPFYSGHAFRGWVVSSFDLNRAISVALEEYPGQLNFHLLPKEPNPGEIVRSIQLSQSELQIGWSRGPNFPPGLDGNLAWAACSAALITLLLAGFVSSLQSLNRRANKLATVQTKALNEIREQYELAVKGSHDGIWDWNIPAQSVYYSPRWKEIFGYAENELSNSYETWHSLIHPDDVERNQTKMNDYFEGRRETYHFEGRFRHKNGEYLWCLVRGEAIRDADGKPVRMAGSLTDITGRKNAELQILAARETAEAATKAKSEFLANMSHEIRTPLTGLLGTANLLRSTPLNADQLDYLEVIHQSADSLLVIINDILDFSKIEANKVTLEEIEFNLNDLTSDVTKMLSYSAAQKGLEFETAFPERLHNHVIGDPARIRQVLLNLISNAIKFTAKGTVRFQVRLLREFDGMARLRFEVTDTGIGMNEEALTAVFGAFSQADTSTTRKYGGTGLGLSICKRLVQLMNSDIQAWSRPNHGSRFWFDLDLPFGSALNDSSDLNESERTEITAGARILVAEDNQINQRVLMEVLRQAGYKPYGASNGLEALERMSSGEVDLVLMDCQMPELDGFEATERWRASIYPAASELPILALTANATKAVRERALASGMNDYLSKPIRPEILVRSIERWLSGRVNAPRVKLDERKLKELSDPARLGSPELLREVVNMFLEQAPMQMIRIVNASAVGDWDTMAKSAHPMKSASGSLGLHALQELFGKIEAWPREKSEGLDPLIQETAEALREAREWLTSRLQAS